MTFFVNLVIIVFIYGHFSQNIPYRHRETTEIQTSVISEVHHPRWLPNFDISDVHKSVNKCRMSFPRKTLCLLNIWILFVRGQSVAFDEYKSGTLQWVTFVC